MFLSGADSTDFTLTVFGRALAVTFLRALEGDSKIVPVAQRVSQNSGVATLK